MSIARELAKRSTGKCELCQSEENLAIYVVAPEKEESLATSVHICATCLGQLTHPETADPNHWRCLNDAMWSAYSPVKVVAWRMLNVLKDEGWPSDLLDMMYMEEAELRWAKDGLPEEGALIHKDSNGVVLEQGDSVVLIKDLQVKGSSIVAKRGVAVRNIRLDLENEKYIEGKVEGQQIVIVTDYVKKI